MIDSQTFADFAATCMYRDEADCTRPVGCCPEHGTRAVGVACAYDTCVVIQPMVRPLINGGFVVSLLEEPGLVDALAGPFSTQREAKVALAKYPTRASGIQALMSRRS